MNRTDLRRENYKQQNDNMNQENERVNTENASMSRVSRRSMRANRNGSDQMAEMKSQNLAKKLNLAMLLLVIGIIAVFLILFFVG